MKVGILGTGFGAYHAGIYKNNPSVDSIKIFGRHEEKLSRIKSELEIATTTSIDEILNDPDIDLVDVCLPNSLHREFALKALEKGKNVFCETPISIDPDDADDIVEAGKRYGKKVFIDLFLRFDPHYCYVKDIGEEKYFAEYSNEGKKEIKTCQEDTVERVIKHVIECCEKGLDTLICAEEAAKSLRTAVKIKEMVNKS